MVSPDPVSRATEKQNDPKNIRHLLIHKDVSMFSSSFNNYPLSSEFTKKHKKHERPHGLVNQLAFAVQRDIFPGSCSWERDEWSLRPPLDHSSKHNCAVEEMVDGGFSYAEYRPPDPLFPVSSA